MCVFVCCCSRPVMYILVWRFSGFLLRRGVWGVFDLVQTVFSLSEQLRNVLEEEGVGKWENWWVKRPNDSRFSILATGISVKVNILRLRNRRSRSVWPLNENRGSQTNRNEFHKFYPPDLNRKSWFRGDYKPTEECKKGLVNPTLPLHEQCVCRWAMCVCVRVFRWGQFMSIVLKTHSVNFLSLAADVWDSSWSLWLSSQSLLIWDWRRNFSSRSCARRKGQKVNLKQFFREVWNQVFSPTCTVLFMQPSICPSTFCTWFSKRFTNKKLKSVVCICTLSLLGYICTNSALLSHSSSSVNFQVLIWI